MQSITQDKDAQLKYWLSFGDVVNPLTINEVLVDPDSELSTGAPVVALAGVNTSQLTDDDGNVYPIGTVVGVTISGGALDESYFVTFRLALNSGESDDRTLIVKIDEQ